MSQVRRILIVDDDGDLRSLLVEQFAFHDDFETLEAGTAEAAMLLAVDQHPDLVIMDVSLPDMDGRDAVAALRQKGFKNPVIIITGHTGDADIVRGLDQGANDYVSKPFRFAVLLARIRAHLRSHESSDEAMFQIGDYSFRPGHKHLVDGKGTKLRLTEKETAILRFLYRAGDHVVPRETLLREVWGYNAAVSTHTLETHIYRLRQKIENDPAQAQLLVTETGGYRLVP
ncbi:response regulator transcription factor [Lichenihabitans sp. Uapishka_5]|uniref:response regulator transcription factor n=1 Tax=Lichenihabitans sp. Uapishka_5 TaxID=3037302 RepID=UPI0029E7DF81|nr:response regulator transcription factor [Lichenihabitans sp. Uapishka_5]MDX7950437.1 response regulator transcription factor [Lichenihabitans sp. Uapishka_5]